MSRSDDGPYHQFPESLESDPDPERRLSAVAQAIRDVERLLGRYKAVRKGAIIELREDGWSLTRIGDVAGVDPSMVSRIARGERR